MGRKKKEYDESIGEDMIRDEIMEEKNLIPREVIEDRKIIIKKTIRLKMNKNYSLKEGQELPEEIDVKFHNSLKNMEVI